MVNKDTIDAIKAFKEVLAAEAALGLANKNLSSCLLMEDIDIKYYALKTEEITKMYEGG